MNVTGATSAATTISAPTDASRATLNYDAFLRLLVAEMKNQDPTQPTDPAQSLSQLASFSGVEQNIKTNAKLDSLMAMAAVNQAGTLIGHTLTSADGKQSGIVTSVAVGASGSTAILQDGTHIDLAAGVMVS